MKTSLSIILLCLTCAVTLSACASQPAQKDDLQARLDAVQKELDAIRYALAESEEGDIPSGLLESSFLPSRKAEELQRAVNQASTWQKMLGANSDLDDKTLLQLIHNLMGKERPLSEIIEELLIVFGDENGDGEDGGEDDIESVISRIKIIIEEDPSDAQSRENGQPRVPRVEILPRELDASGAKRPELAIKRPLEIIAPPMLSPEMRAELERIRSRLRPAQREALDRILRHIAAAQPRVMQPQTLRPEKLRECPKERCEKCPQRETCPQNKGDKPACPKMQGNDRGKAPRADDAQDRPALERIAGQLRELREMMKNLMASHEQSRAQMAEMMKMQREEMRKRDERIEKLEQSVRELKKEVEKLKKEDK